ncbi:Gfo/Idh/MocA family oxidoreductase [Streptacidiphilus albus]|uniref:Gfo/Idh/MocA family oxidoreductase n=1 Tax=Streptacidiphilus albus TaxID=105425 RepID=UPI00054B7BED|nr:Gfo/Idh/MocA family oxidoreductase [Streptacidiphilus albus]
MFHTLVVGLGRAGAGLHIPVLLRARRAQPQLFAPGPLVGVDPHPAGAGRSGGSGAGPELRLAASLRHVAQLPPPDRTVVHVCTPPVARVDIVGRLLDLGYRRLVLEKPLAVEPTQLRSLAGLFEASKAEVAVVAPWSASVLTDRLVRLVADASPTGPGRLRGIDVIQYKPRFQRSLATCGHPTAFDIEVPHALGVLLQLAGDAEVTAAGTTDLALGSALLPRLGSARLGLRHHSGVRSEIHSDLTSPVRERRITLHFDRGTAVGHYPGSADDEYAQLRFTTGESGPPAAPEVFADDALTAFVLRSYAGFAAGFAGGPGFRADLERQFRVVELLSRAKQFGAADGGPPVIEDHPERELSHVP